MGIHLVGMDLSPIIPTGLILLFQAISQSRHSWPNMNISYENLYTVLQFSI